MISFFIKLIRSIVRAFNIDIVKYRSGYLQDFEPHHKRIWEKTSSYSLLNKGKLFTIINAVDYLEKSAIKGDFVQTGVYQGGSVMMVLFRLKELKSVSRSFFLYDTYEGMPEPTKYDVSFFGQKAIKKYNKVKLGKSSVGSNWVNASLEEVKKNIKLANYPLNKLHFIKGKIEDTIPKTIPKKIAFLHLDTDFYESTKHSLQYLYDLVVPGGIVIFDDYFHWQGCKKAIDEFIEKRKEPIFLNRIDYSSRLIVKRGR